MLLRMPLYLALAAAMCWGEPPVAGHLPKPAQSALDRISPDSLRGHLAFPASDLPEGRNPPWPGLDIAAEYIAAQFRRAGLETIPGANSYYQVANWKLRKINLNDTHVAFEIADRQIPVDGSQLTVFKLDGL